MTFKLHCIALLLVFLCLFSVIVDFMVDKILCALETNETNERTGEQTVQAYISPNDFIHIR